MDALTKLEIESRGWLAECFEDLTTELELLEPSEWAEKKRYLPKSVTPLPGMYDFGVAPYLIEIVNCSSPYSPIREIDVLKGVQTCFTVGVIENTIGYCIDYIKDAPMMFLTADAELAKIRIDQYITPMLSHSGLEHLIQSTDEKNTRKTGKTDKKMSWKGGGFMIPFGAKNADKLRSISVQYLLEDEIDAYPDKVGKDGDPLVLAQDRTASYEATRKIIRGSTPLITQTSKAWREYKKGDQREYRVPCKSCGEKQKLVWHGVNKEDGTVYGIVWKSDEHGNVVPGSVRYVCKFCQHEMTNEDKAWMYRDRGAHCEWVPTAVPVSPDRRSYHISALYSPVGMQTWEVQVRKFLNCFDPVEQKITDIEAYQTFRNNVEGLPFEQRGEQLKFEVVRENRSIHYKSGMVPNKLAIEQTGSRVLFLVASVDVHKRHLDVLVQGVCEKGIQYSIEWFKIEGTDCTSLQDPAWEKLEQFIDTRTYESDDGHAYRAVATLVDSQYSSGTVYDFCQQYGTGVWAIAGRSRTNVNHYKPFGQFDTKVGTTAFFITVDHYKDKLAAKLKQPYDGRGFMKPGQMIFPEDYNDQFFKELTKEQKVQVFDSKTNKSKGHIWKRPGSSDNHAWDLTVYCTAAVDMVASDFTTSQYGDVGFIMWDTFWEYAQTGVYTVKGSFE